MRLLTLAIIAIILPCISGRAAQTTKLFSVGIARADITPAYPIRLSGYAARKAESEGVAQRLSAKAIAIGTDREGPALLLTVDNTGVPKAIRDEVARFLKERHHIKTERVTICSSHSHTAPCLAGNLPTLFGEPLPPEHEAHIQQYTRELISTLERIAEEALKNRQPARLSWGQGQAGFAKNRRTKGGPTDHDLPLLAVTSPKGELRGILLEYACHCTTLGGETNLICGDWAGYAQDYLEQDHPGAVAMVAIGCAGDANPDPRTSLAYAQQHGHEIEAAVNELLGQTLRPISGKLDCKTKALELPFATARTKAEWEQLAHGTDKYAAYYAKLNLARVERGEVLPTTLPYLVQCWSFGEQLAFVFLAGEVVVDYSTRLKKEFDRSRLWVTAYANDVPCYIPSERILKEGGYEGGGAMVYYNRPNRLAPGIEDQIVKAVHEVVPPAFLSDERKAELPPPKSPAESLEAIQTKAGLRVELVAAEPLVVDPVAIDWGADGRLWVVEMRDYPMGMDGKWKAGSRVKCLEDTNGDGKYDKATIVADELPFATGITAWRNGALVCSAPDILYVEKGAVTKLFTGFVTENYQARVNSLSLGLDNWIYGANGLLGGAIHGESARLLHTSNSAADKGTTTVDIRGRDFRMKPDTGEFEPASGLTQQGRARDDWGNWFGCDNSTLAWHYPLPDHYIRRNPHVAAPSPRVSIAGGTDPNLLHPISRMLERFNDPNAAGRVTSGCGLGIYRDTLLGQEYYGDVFVCDPVHNLVHRLKLHDAGVTFSGLRAPDEEQSEFLASRDNWFRPVQARTGPDGALYVVDMYRFVIEHPRWISKERLARLDVRAGDTMGRIYRVTPGSALTKIPNLTRLSAEKLAAALDTPNGTERDRVHQELLFGTRTWSERERRRITEVLERLALHSTNPAVRVQTACVLDGLARGTGIFVEQTSDRNPAVRANAVRLLEPVFRITATKPVMASNEYDLFHRATNTLCRLADDPDVRVRFQVALTLGEWRHIQAGVTLAKIAARDCGDGWMRAAVLSSAANQPVEILNTALSLTPKQRGRSELIRDLIATVVGTGDANNLGSALKSLVPPEPASAAAWQLAALTTLLDSLERKGTLHSSLQPNDSSPNRFDKLFVWAHEAAADPHANETSRASAIRFLGRNPERASADLVLLIRLADESGPIGSAAFEALKRFRGNEVPMKLLASWQTRAPSVRQQAIELLLARDEWVKPLLQAVQQHEVGANEISPTARQQLCHHKDRGIAQLAQSIWSQQSATRAEVLARYQPATELTGDTAKGATLFANTCATCHRVRGSGNSVGPELTPLAGKSPADFLLAILDPNAAVEPRYIAYNIETKDGRSLTGIVNAETATTLTLVQAGGLKENILRSDIESIRASGVSLMPEGLESVLKPQDLADLIAYLKSGPRPFGSATVEQARAAEMKFRAAGGFGCLNLKSGFDALPYGSWMGQLPLHYCRQTDGNSKVSWSTGPVGDGGGEFVQFQVPAAMGWASDKAGSFVMTCNGTSPVKFDVTLNDHTWQSADGRVQASYQVEENNAEDSNGVLTISVARTLARRGEAVRFEVTGSAADSQRWFGIYEPLNAGTRAAK